MTLMRLRIFFVILATAVGAVSAQTPGDNLPPVKPLSMVRKLAPVYPLDLLLAGKTGWAEVRFMVDYSGRPTMASIAGSSNPLFGQALLAEIESHEFMPPRVNGQPQIALSGQRYAFDGEANLDATEKRILAELRKPSPAIVPSTELDPPLKGTRREPPLYPSTLLSEGISGKTEIEFIVTQEGRVVFPKVLSATVEDFGWAAATAIVRWRFQPPTKGSQKVDTRTRITVTYDHTKSTATF